MINIDDFYKVDIRVGTIKALYTPEELVGKQVVCCVNLEPMHIGSVKSEVRILGSGSKQGVVLLQPSESVSNGDRIF